MVSDSVRNAAPAPVGMRYSGTAACSRSRLTATPPLAGDGGGEDRLGVEEADDPAGRARAARVDGAGDAAAAVHGRDHLEHLVAVAGA